MKFEKVKIKILELLKDGKFYYTSEIVKELGYKRTSTSWVLHVLNCLKIDNCVKSGKDGKKLTWEIKGG